MSDETVDLFMFFVGIAIGIGIVTGLFNTSQNEVLCLKLNPNNAKNYEYCKRQSFYTNVTKIKITPNQ